MTIASLWEPLVDIGQVDDALTWPPDVFALVDRVLEASEAYRFVVSPPAGVVLGPVGEGAGAAATDWWEWLDGDRDAPPPSVAQWWKVVVGAVDVDVVELSAGREWQVTEALLTLHAIADEACAGLGTATSVPPGPGCRFRAAARELLAHAGSLSRVPPGVLVVLPRCRTGIAGMSIHSLSRYVCVRGPQVDVEWHRMPSRPTGTTLPEAHANVVLLPWPMRVRARDFRRVAYTLPQMDMAEFGFFEFAPEEALDLDLLDAVLRAAEDEAGAVDVVFLPESAMTPEDIEPLETLLAEHGVWFLVAGVREPRSSETGLGANRVHVGVRQEMVWRHATQHKHHRWCLDGRQISQYHLGGSLSPMRSWWEAVSIPRRSLQVIDQGAMTLVPLVCEDLARLEPVTDLLRSIGPSLVMTLLLDGPQLASRWTARYASVLADDPGSAVLTLTSYGMVRRCRPAGCAASTVIALWKDPSGGMTEITLEHGADAVLIATALSYGDSTTADGRHHRGTTSNITLAAIHSLHAERPEHGPSTRRPLAPPADAERGLPRLDEREVTKATSWVEAFAEAFVADPASVDVLLDAATAPEWRAPLGLPAPTRLFLHSIATLRRELPDPLTLDGLLDAIDRLREADDPAAVVTGTLLSIALEQRLFAEAMAGRVPVEVLELFARTTG